MQPKFHFTFEKHWQAAPLAFWVHLPVTGTQAYEPAAPAEVPHRGFRLLRVQFEAFELQFSSPEQVDHFIDVLSRKPLPTSRQLSATRGLAVGPNGHWLSRLPAKLKSPRTRARLVPFMRHVRSLAFPAAD